MLQNLIIMKNIFFQQQPPSRDSPFVNTLIVHQIQTPTLRHLTLSEYADQIIDAWLAALMAKGKKFHSSHLHYLSVSKKNENFLINIFF